jgi:hypothetical protein
MFHNAYTEGIHQWVSEVSLIEDNFATNIWKPEAVTVTTNSGNDPGQYATSIGRICGAKAKRIHNSNRACTHRQNIADDSTDAGCRALVWLNK